MASSATRLDGRAPFSPPHGRGCRGRSDPRCRTSASRTCANRPCCRRSGGPLGGKPCRAQDLTILSGMGLRSISGAANRTRQRAMKAGFVGIDGQRSDMSRGEPCGTRDLCRAVHRRSSFSNGSAFHAVIPSASRSLLHCRVSAVRISGRAVMYRFEGNRSGFPPDRCLLIELITPLTIFGAKNLEISKGTCRLDQLSKRGVKL